MGQALQPSGDQGIEYSVYIFHHPKKNKGGQNNWEMKRTTNNMHKAMKIAEKLHGSREYHKVEVKKKFFDSKNDRAIDMTLKVFENKPRGDINLSVWLLAVAGLGAAGFGLTYLFLMLTAGS